MAKIMNVKQQTRQMPPMRVPPSKPTRVMPEIPKYMPEIPKQEKMLEIPKEPMQEKMLEIPKEPMQEKMLEIPNEIPKQDERAPMQEKILEPPIPEFLRRSGGYPLPPKSPLGPVKNAIQPLGMKRGGAVRSKPQTKFASGGSTNSASKRGDGIAQRGKTKGRMC